VSFLYQDEIVAFFDLTRLGKSQEEVAGKLVYFYQGYLSESRIQQGDGQTYESETAVCAGEDGSGCRKP